MNENLWSLALIASLNFALLAWLGFRPIRMRAHIKTLKQEVRDLNERLDDQSMYRSFGARERQRLNGEIWALTEQKDELTRQLAKWKSGEYTRGSTE